LRTPLWIIAVALLAVAARTPTPKIGVVDLERVFEAHPGKPRMEAALVELRERFEETIGNLTRRKSELEEAIGVYEAGSAKRDEIDKELILVDRELEYERNRATSSFRNRKLAAREKIVQEVGATIRKSGAERGYSVILQQRMSISSDLPTWDAVLYHSSPIDLTDEIIETLRENAAAKEFKEKTK